MLEEALRRIGALENLCSRILQRLEQYVFPAPETSETPIELEDDPANESMDSSPGEVSDPESADRSSKKGDGDSKRKGSRKKTSSSPDDIGA